MAEKKGKSKKPIFVYVSEELHNRLVELAHEKEGGNLSSLVRDLLAKYVKAKNKTK